MTDEKTKGSVKQMTLKELSKLRWINKRIEGLRERILIVESKAEKTTTLFSKVPTGGAKFDIKDNLIDLKSELEQMLKECVTEQKRLEEYIHSVEDVQIQNIMTYRFVNGFSWQKVAFKIGGGNTADSVRKRVVRYLK